jgi:magnesium transporter
VIDASRVLEGVITLRTLLLTDDQECIEKIIDKKVISVHTDEDVENVADLFNKYDFMTLPVVDSENRLVGIITVDDVIDIIQEEDTEDFEKMAGTLPSDKPYLKTSVWKLAKNRMGWLVLLMLSGTITALILTEFEDAFLVIPVLVTFIPMLTDTGGNSGAQSSTLIIRGMVLHEIETKDLFKVLFKELKVSLMAGSFLALITYIRLILTYPDKPLIVFVVSIAILATVIIAKLVGALLPFFAKIIKADPAIMAAPLITTIVDAASLLVYFYLARMILHI